MLFRSFQKVNGDSRNLVLGITELVDRVNHAANRTAVNPQSSFVSPAPTPPTSKDTVEPVTLFQTKNSS